MAAICDGLSLDLLTKELKKHRRFLNSDAGRFPQTTEIQNSRNRQYQNALFNVRQGLTEQSWLGARAKPRNPSRVEDGQFREAV